MISPVSASVSPLAISALQQVSAATNSAAVAAPTSSGKGDSVELSGPAKLFSALQQLASQDPAKFKTVTADIASKLQAAAGTDSTSGTSGNSFLATLASKFQQASQTGDVSVLQPPSGGHHSHHGHHGGGGVYNRQGQVTPPTQTQSGGVDLKSLFQSITKEVSDALAA